MELDEQLRLSRAHDLKHSNLGLAWMLVHGGSNACNPPPTVCRQSNTEEDNLGMSWGSRLLMMKTPALGVLWLLKGQRGAQQVGEGQDQSSWSWQHSWW